MLMCLYSFVAWSAVFSGRFYSFASIKLAFAICRSFVRNKYKLIDTEETKSSRKVSNAIKTIFN